MSESHYLRLGGAKRIAALIEDSLDRHAVNPVLAPLLRGKDLPRLKDVGMQFLCALGMNEHELAAAIRDIAAALHEMNEVNQEKRACE